MASFVFALTTTVIRQTTRGTGLDTAGNVAAIVTACITVALLVAGVIRWWWRTRRRVRSVDAVITRSGDDPPRIYVSFGGVPVSIDRLTAEITDRAGIRKRIGPWAHRTDIEASNVYPLDEGYPALDLATTKFKVELFGEYINGDRRTIFKKKVANPGASAN